MRTFIVILFIATLGIFLQGCSTPQRATEPEKIFLQANERVDFTDPILNSRQILLYGPIDQQAAELVIQKLLFLDSKSHDPIDFYLKSPGGDIQDAFAIEKVMSLVHSPVNTYALSECNSGGVVLLAAGTGKRRTFHGVLILLHGLEFQGNPPPAYVGGVQDAYSDFWRKHARLPQSWLPLPFGRVRILSAKEALDCGIVDEVVDK